MATASPGLKTPREGLPHQPYLLRPPDAEAKHGNTRGSSMIWLLAKGGARRDALRRQRVLDQLDPVRGAVDDRLVVEIVGGMMEPCAVAIAAEDKRARP
jgi:hypothetical protein